MSRQQNQRKNSRNSKSRAHLDSTFRAKRVPIRVAHHKHTGRRLPFYCTSYAALFFILVFISAFVLLITINVHADQQVGTINLSGQVKGKPPEIPAKLTSPPIQSHFTQSRVEVSGTCLAGTYIEIYRKDIFAGMTICTPEGTFAITITLVPGENLIIAKTRDSLGQYGPDSGVLVIYYDLSASSGVSQLKPFLIYTDPVQRGLSINQNLYLDYEVDGGEAPYTVAIDWGDGSPTYLAKHDKKGDFSSAHTYKTSGQRTIYISGIDAEGRKATIQTIVVIHPPSVVASGSSTCEGAGSFAEYCFPSNSLLIKITEIIWPAIIIAALMTLSFWVGERVIVREMHLKH